MEKLEQELLAKKNKELVELFGLKSVQVVQYWKKNNKVPPKHLIAYLRMQQSNQKWYVSSAKWICYKVLQQRSI